MQIGISQKETYQVIDLNLGEDIVEPRDINDLHLVNNVHLNFEKGVVISGRAPIWAHSAITHICHPAVWVAHYDPRLGGAVVVQSHKKGIAVGDVIKVGEDD